MLKELITVNELVFEEVEEILKLAELTLINARPTNFYLRAQTTVEDRARFEVETQELFQRARKKLSQMSPALHDTPQWRNLYARAEQV